MAAKLLGAGMRTRYVIVAVAAAVAGAIGASFGRTDSGSGEHASPTPRNDEIRLAQNMDPVSTGNPSLAPLKWVGMVINPTPTQKDPNLVNECTGQFIKPNIVLTAGHCVKDIITNPTGPWYDLSKQTFVLQYQNGEGSHTFKTICAATPSRATVR